MLDVRIKLYSSVQLLRLVSIWRPQNFSCNLILLLQLDYPKLAFCIIIFLPSIHSLYFIQLYDMTSFVISLLHQCLANKAWLPFNRRHVTISNDNLIGLSLKRSVLVLSANDVARCILGLTKVQTEPCFLFQFLVFQTGLRITSISYFSVTCLLTIVGIPFNALLKNHRPSVA